MAKIDRLERLDRLREEAEDEYRDTLVKALQRCASGVWGLFDHNGDRWTRAAYESEIGTLAGLAESIDRMRERLNLGPFELHREFEASRGPVASSAVGEPKQAKAWLARMTLADG